MTPERVEDIYNELETLVIELDADPTVKGPIYLQDLISKTRGYLNRTSLLIHEVHRERHALERDLDAQEAAYQLRSDALLADDHRVTRLPNIDDRKAMISLILREDRVKILDLKRQVKELGFVEKAVKHRHKELDNTMSSIRMQKSLIDSEIRTGSFYGDEGDASRKNAVPKLPSEDISSDELSDLLEQSMREVTAEAATAPAAPSDPEPPPQPVVEAQAEEPKVEPAKAAEDPDITRFLDGDDDFDEILASIEV